jgi:thioredoxin reductase (NADPH)
MMGFGLSTCATCDGAFFMDKEIMVIGGGDSACEEAMFLTKFGKRVRLVHRRDQLRASKIMAARTVEHPKIEMVWNNHLVEILGDRNTGVTGAVLENTVTGERTTLQTDAIFYGIGHTPNTKLFTHALEHDENGYLVTKPRSTATNIPGVFACGDVQDHTYRQAITAAGSGCMAAIDVERYLSGLGH